MTLPTSIKIGAYSVSVQLDRHIMTDEDKCGYYNARTKTIVIDPDLGEQFTYGVFIHEVIEAIKDIYSIDALRNDHHAIDLLGEGIHQVLRDNGKEMLPK